MARELGMSVWRAQLEVSSAEFSEWLAFCRAVPHPADVRIARLCAVVAQLAGNKRATTADFLPDYWARAHKGADLKTRLKARLRIIVEAQTKRVAG